MQLLLTVLLVLLLPGLFVLIAMVNIPWEIFYLMGCVIYIPVALFFIVAVAEVVLEIRDKHGT